MVHRKGKAWRFLLALLVIPALVSSCQLFNKLTTNPPVADAGLDKTNAAVGTAVNLSGAGSTDATTYAWTLAEKPAGSNLTTVDITNSGKVSASFVPDIAGLYILSLKVTNAAGQSTATVKITAKGTAGGTGTTAPGSPTGLAFVSGSMVASTTNVGDWSLQLKWNKVTGADGYYIYVNETGTTFNSALAFYTAVGGTTQTLTLGDVLPSTDNYYWITAFNAAGESTLPTATTAGVKVTTPALGGTVPTGPSAPLGLAATTPVLNSGGTAFNVTLSWTAPTGATGYYVYYYDTTDPFALATTAWDWTKTYWDSSASITIPTSGTSVTAAVSVPVSTTRYYYVSAYDTNYIEGDAKTPGMKVTTGTAVVIPTTAPAAFGISSSNTLTTGFYTVTLSWALDSTVTTYKLYSHDTTDAVASATLVTGFTYTAGVSTVTGTVSVPLGTTRYYYLSSSTSAGEGPKTAGLAVYTTGTVGALGLN